MDTIYQLGIELILFLQSLGAWLTGPMNFFTSLGYEEFYLFVAPAILWCWNYTLGLQIGIFLMVSGITNNALKLIFHGPRPYWVDERVRALALRPEYSFGAPSGHAQNAVVVWGALAVKINRSWSWVIALILMFFIGVSRMYLGVHFPHDTLIGWLAGALLLWALLRFEAPVIAWLKRYSLSAQALIAFGISLVFILAGALPLLALQGWELPAEWIQLAMKGYPDGGPPTPLELSGTISNAGVFFGLALGAIMLKQRGGYDAGGPIWQRVVRFLIGAIGIGVIWFGLGELFPRGEALLPFILRYIRYGLVGLWVTALAPMLFIAVKLAQPETD